MRANLELGSRRPRRLPSASAMAILVFVSLDSAWSYSVIARRHRTDRTCSLQTVEGDDIEPMDNCAFLPGMGENRHKRVLIQFGESNCVITLRNCLPVS